MSWRIAVRHHTGYHYAAPLRASYNEARMTPVSGDGQTVGEAISGHVDVDMVSFTGSTQAGKRVSELASKTVKRFATVRAVASTRRAGKSGWTNFCTIVAKTAAMSTG